VSGAWGTPPEPPEGGSSPAPPSAPPPGSAPPSAPPPPSAAWDQPASGASPASPSAQRPRTSGLAVASLVTGLFVWCFLIPGIVAIVLGFLAIEQINDGGGRVKGRGMAITGIVLGYVGVAVVALLVALWVISILV
jgi:Domain of unknown function (DUF4190)